MYMDEIGCIKNEPQLTFVSAAHPYIFFIL